MSAMNKPVDERGGEPAIINHSVPSSEPKVHDDGHTSAPMAASGYLEQEPRCVAAQGQKVQFVCDKQIA
jgi:hypothetical protein